MTEYLSRDPERINANQRARRTKMRRLDYMPSREALRVIENRRAECRPGSMQATNSAVIDSIILAWAAATGINYKTVRSPMASAASPELSDEYARANDFGGRRADNRVEQCGARTRAGTPCKSKPASANGRCKWHGGASTGPRTADGKSRALANLRQFRAPDRAL